MANRVSDVSSKRVKNAFFVFLALVEKSGLKDPGLKGQGLKLPATTYD